jgi:hypothetical protein
MKLSYCIAVVFIAYTPAFCHGALLLRTTGSLIGANNYVAADAGSQIESDEDAESKVDGGALSTVSRCIIIIACQFMLVSTALAVIRTCHEFSGTSRAKVSKSLQAASQTATYGPMLCVLFIACRMHVEFLSDGKDEPQLWVQDCMYALTFAVLASTVLALLVPLLAQRLLPNRPRHDLEISKLEEHGKVGFHLINAALLVILLGICCGLAIVIVGIHVYAPPGATGLNAALPLAPAVKYTAVLALLFFLTQFVVGACRTYTEFVNVASPRLTGAMTGAAGAMEFAPMLAVLFLAARMRALQHDGQPQKWAQDCMFASTCGICATTALATLVPIALGGNANRSEALRDFPTAAAPSPAIGYFLIAARFVCMFAFYGGAMGVIYSIYIFEAPAGPEATFAVSPTVQCVVNLACQFFFVYFMMALMLTVSELSKVSLETNKLFYAIESSKGAVQFAPMLSILFVATRMYALLITDKKGAPQAWVQDGMFVATWSLLVSFLLCLLRGLFVDEMQLDEAGNAVHKFENKHRAAAATILRYFTMLVLYGGISMVIVGLFVMTPETANGRGAVPLL